jgi:hypothetical protein
MHRIGTSVLVGCLLGVLAAGHLWADPEGHKAVEVKQVVAEAGSTPKVPFALLQDEIKVAGGMFGGSFFAVCKEGFRFAIVAVIEVEKDKKIPETVLKRALVDNKGQRYQPIGFGFPSQGAPRTMPFLMTQGMFTGDIAIAETPKSLLALYFVVPKEAKSFSIEQDGNNVDVRILKEWKPDDAVKIPGYRMYGSIESGHPSIEKDGWGMK